MNNSKIRVAEINYLIQKSVRKKVLESERKKQITKEG